MEGPVPTGPHHTRIDETLEVMTERRGRHVHMSLNRPSSGAFRARLHDVSQDRQANRVPESPELLGVMIQLAAHSLFLIYSKHERKPTLLLKIRGLVWPAFERSGTDCAFSSDSLPWFRDATIREITAVERPSPHHLRWPDLDIDLAVDSIEHPERFPLVSQAPLKRQRRSDRRVRSSPFYRTPNTGQPISVCQPAGGVRGSTR